MPAELTPIGDIQHPRIRTQISLPYHMENEIGLNTKYLQTLIQIAGIKHVHISSENGTTSKAEVSIMSINRDGSAIAGKNKVKTIPTYSQNLTPDHSSTITSSKSYFWPSLDITINPNETRDRMLNSSGNNYSELKNPYNWSKEINKAIKNAVRNAGKKNLVGTIPTMLDGIWIGSFCLSLTSFLTSHLSDPGTILFHYALKYFSNTFVIHTENLKKGEGYRLSLVPGFEIDRLLLLQTYSRIKPLVKPLEKN